MPIFWETTEEFEFNIPQKKLDELFASFIKNEVANIILCDNEYIHRLNKEYRHKDYPTDVISFSMKEGEGAEFSGDLLGDIYISYDKVIEQAKEYFETVEEEFVRLVIHGIMHLLGYNHIEEEDRKLMEEKELELFNRFYIKESGK